MSEKMDELIDIMREILKYTKFAGTKEIRNILTTLLDTEQKRTVYHLSDGNKGSVEIAKAASVSDFTVRKYWSIWARQGIVESLKVRGGERYKKSFELEDFGLEVPQMKIVKTESSEVREDSTK